MFIGQASPYVRHRGWLILAPSGAFVLERSIRVDIKIIPVEQINTAAYNSRVEPGQRSTGETTG